MTNQQFLQAFKNLQSEVKELKTLLQRVFLLLEILNDSKTETPSFIEERISVKETCQILRCSEVSLWKLRRDGVIPYTRHKRTIRLKKIDVLNYLNQKG